eukprot:1152170-Pelagomonas_calceolata.AAC.16
MQLKPGSLKVLDFEGVPSEALKGALTGGRGDTRQRSPHKEAPGHPIKVGSLSMENRVFMSQTTWDIKLKKGMPRTTWDVELKKRMPRPHREAAMSLKHRFLLVPFRKNE